MPVSADCYLLCIMMAFDTEILFFLHGRHKFSFLADRTNGRAIGTVLRLSVVVCDVMYCG